MSWRVAKSLDKLLSQINLLAPNRSTVSDGSVGDAAHATTDSDHNPHVKDGDMGIVTARDFTHDPVPGADMHRITEKLRQSKDVRIKYVIWDNRMFSSYSTSTHAPFTWRPYSGSNPHTKHAHVSVQPAKNLYDDTRSWSVPQPVKVWHLKATKDGTTKEVVRKSWDTAREWIRDHAKKGWRVIITKRLR
jgi:hypothetical protein